MSVIAHKLGWIGLLWLNIGVIAAGVMYVPDLARPQAVITRVSSPVIGDSFEVAFNQPVDRASVLESLTITPDIVVQAVWSEDGRGLQLVPREALQPGISYKLAISDIRPALPLLLPLQAQAAATFETDPISVTNAGNVLNSADVAHNSVTPGGLPAIEQSSFVLNGERVDVPVPRHREGTYIDIDLTREILTIFADGRVEHMFSISAQGPPNFPTPTGEFEIGYRNTNHLSSISNVWMPWSLQFFGDYFIHEVPYYRDGTLVTTKYSGGCIRLEKGVAELVYNIAQKGTKVVVYRS